MERHLPARWIMQTLGILLIFFLFLAVLNQIKLLGSPPNVLRLTGEGKLLAVPDTASVRISVISEGPNIIEVKNTNNQKMNQVIDFIKSNHVKANDIKTSDYNTSPKYNYNNGQNNIIGYQATQTITIKLTGIDKSRNQLQTILGGVINNGANAIQGVDYSFTNIELLKESAIKLAIANAKENARTLTKEVGLRLGKPINIVISANEYIQPMVVGLAQMAVAKSTNPTIEPGTQEIKENVTIEFEVFKK